MNGQSIDFIRKLNILFFADSCLEMSEAWRKIIFMVDSILFVWIPSTIESIKKFDLMSKCLCFQIKELIIF